MLSDRTFISLSRNFWDDVWRSRQQVMSRLARDNTVVFVSRPLSVEEAVSWNSAGSPLRRPGAHRVTERLHAYVPPRHLPTVYRVPAIERILDAQRRAGLRRFVDRLRPGDVPILYLWHPDFEPYLDTFPDSLICYHLFDDLAYYHDGPADETRRTLERIFRRADLVFVSSEELAERYSHFGNVHWIPNGVDYEGFVSSEVLAAQVPGDLARIPQPRLTYAGTLRAQIDIQLLAAIASARPDWALVLIGDVSRAAERSLEYQQLRHLPNVYALGSKRMDEMPVYLRHTDVGLLPYRLDGAAAYCYPLKMHEYLAAGLPIVSSRLRAVAPFRSVIQTAQTVNEWVDAIGVALTHKAPHDLEERRRVAAQNSWDSRVERISALIGEREAARQVQLRRAN